MQLEDILVPERCYCAIDGISKKRVLKTISEFIEKDVEHLHADKTFTALMERERLGSTGLGQGIAIPHCRVSSCNEIIGCLVTLSQPIDFDAVDSKPVDLLFVLIVPEQKTDDHVKVLAQVAGLFNDEVFCSRLRNARECKDLFNVAIAFQST